VCIIHTANSRDVIKALVADGWALKRVNGSHHHYAHPSKTGIVTVPHPKKDLPRGTLRSVERQSGLKLR
jgi:predicted RNA binding protein YcfA (HicA-like mRNA interferase family)